MSLNDKEVALLREALAGALTAGAFPLVADLQQRYPEEEANIDELAELGFVYVEVDRCILTWKGLIAADQEAAKKEIAACEALAPALKEALGQPGNMSTATLAAAVGKDVAAVGMTINLATEYIVGVQVTFDKKTGFVETVKVPEEADVWIGKESSDPSWPPSLNEAASPTSTAPAPLQEISIAGYRAFRDLTAVVGGLSIIVGANGSGKSSLFEFLRFLCFAVQTPLPAEIDPGSAGRKLFHIGSPEKITWKIQVALDRRMTLVYSASIQGPMGQPRVIDEILKTVETTIGWRQPFCFIRPSNKKRGLANRKQLWNWTSWDSLPQNELVLRRVLDPTIKTPARFRDYIAGWRFYSGFDVSASASIRRPTLSQPDAVLSPDGGNLSAVLFSLMTDHQERWQELESNLRACIPGFESLAVKPRGGPGMVMATIREAGCGEELTLADLSDGTLRFLAWAALCLSPRAPTLICIDEPELGLHPRALPVLAGLLRQASATTQVLCATQSPYFLSQFSLDEIAVMRKEDGQAVFARPASSAALRAEVADLGEDALLQLYLSGELETRS